MNSFIFSRNLKEEGPTKVELMLSDAIHDMVIEAMREQFFIDILHRKREQRAEGITYYRFYLPNDVAELLKQAVIQACTRATGYNRSN